MRNIEQEILEILKAQGSMPKKELIDRVYQNTGLYKYRINNCWLSLKHAKKVGFVKGRVGIVTIVPENNKVEQKFPVCGAQFPPDHAMTKECFEKLYAQFDGEFFDFLRIDGNNASAYFMIKQEVYERWEIDGRLSNFEMYIREILNDMDMEHENGMYEFDGTKFLFIYA